MSCKPQIPKTLRRRLRRFAPANRKTITPVPSKPLRAARRHKPPTRATKAKGLTRPTPVARLARHGAGRHARTLQVDLARRVGVTDRTIRNVLGQLVEKGLLRVGIGRGASRCRVRSAPPRWIAERAVFRCNRKTRVIYCGKSRFLRPIRDHNCVPFLCSTLDAGTRTPRERKRRLGGKAA
jgi:hypothetical protein